jgi:hypothetical protein
MKRKKLSLLTLPEIQNLEALANFTDLQGDIFKFLCREKSDIYIMTTLYISNRRFYEEKSVIYAKVRRILGENNVLSL